MSNYMFGSLSFQRCPEIGDHADFKRLLIQNMVTKNKKHLCQNFQLMDNGRLMIERRELEIFFRLYHEIVVKKSKSKNDLSWFFIETPRIVDQGKSDKGSLNGLHRMFMDLDIMLKMENKDDFNQIYFDKAVNGIVKILSKATYNKALPPTTLANDSENMVKHDYHDKLKMSRIVIRDSLPSVKEISGEKFLKIGVHLVWPNLMTRVGRDENNQFYSEMYHSVYSHCGGAKGPHFQEIKGVKKYSWDKDTSGNLSEKFTFDTSVLTRKDSKLRMPYSFKAEECKECRRKTKDEADICIKCFGKRRVACLERGVYRPTRDIQMKMDENGNVKAVITEYSSRLLENANECTFEEFRSSVIHTDLKINDLTKDPASGITNEEMDKYIFTLSEDKCDSLNYDTKKRKRKPASRNRVGTRKTDYLNTLNMAKNDTKRRRIKGYQEIQIPYQEFESTKRLILNQVIMKFDYKVHKSMNLKIQVYGDLEEGATTPFALENVQFNYMTESKVIQALKAEISRKSRGMDLSQLKNQLSTFAQFKKIVKTYFNCNGNDQNGDSPPPYMIQIRTNSRLCVVKFKSEINKIIHHTHTENVKPMDTFFVKIINLTLEMSNKSTITPWKLKDMGLQTTNMLFEMHENYTKNQFLHLNDQKLLDIFGLIKLHNLKLKDTKEKIISFFNSVQHNSNCVKLTLAPEFDFDNHPSPKVEEKYKNDKLKICGWYLYFGCWSQSGVCSSKRGFKKKHHLKKLDRKKYKNLNDELTTHFENVCKGNDQIFHDITVQAIASKLK